MSWAGTRVPVMVHILQFILKILMEMMSKFWYVQAVLVFGSMKLPTAAKRWQKRCKIINSMI